MSDDAKTVKMVEDRRSRWAIRERWSYVILALIMAVMFILLGGFTIKYVNDNNKAWCDIIAAVLPATAPVMPSDPKDHPDQVKRYNDYILVVKLGHRLGCL
jgi:hypothetical protein